MKKIFLILFLVFASTVFAGTDDAITIDGVIGSSFDKEKVQVYDTLDQTFFLPRKFLPKNIQMKAGTPFSIEMDEKSYDKLDIKPSDKKIKVQISLEKKTKK